MSPLFGHKEPRTTMYFASDLHGSDKCFRKFLNGGKIYEADIMILGGDVAGKAIQAVTRAGPGTYRCLFRGVQYEVGEGDEVRDLEQMIADFGYYPYRADPGELDERRADGSIDKLFFELMVERLRRWTELADERLRPLGIPLYWMLGNDDPNELEPVLDAAPWGVHGDGRVERLASGHELLSLGYSNTTPWNSYRELPDDEILLRLETLAATLESPHRSIFNVHVPPYDTGIDEAPVLAADLTVQQSGGQVKMAPAGSPAVRKVIEDVQPLLGLHGHIHESSGFRQIGRTLCVNPGSDYGTGTVNGFIVTVEPDRIRSHQFVRG